LFDGHRTGQTPRTDVSACYLMLHSISLKTLMKRRTSSGLEKNPSTP
jgi:hypothetical protein